MARCPVCGTVFDDFGYQVFLPGNPQPFDRLDCARAYAGLAMAPMGPEADEAAAAVAPLLLRRLALPAVGAALAAATLAAAGVFWLQPAAQTAEAMRDLAERALPSREGLRNLRPPIEAQAPAAARERKPKAGPAAHRKTTRRVRPTVAAGLVSARPGPGSTVRAARKPPPVSSPPSPPAPPPAARPPVPPPPPVAVRQPAPVSTKKMPGATRPGWGHGDKKHEHTGPPGQANQSAGGKGR